MTAYVITGSGVTLELPKATTWEMNYGMGLPCDSFSMVMPWAGDLPYGLETWARFQAVYQGAVVFTGVIDEVEAGFTEKGRMIEVAGRGMAARLLDNDVLGVEYMMATLDDIIGTYVTPFGVTVGERGSFPSRLAYVVETGSSAWSVVEDFVSYYSDVVPRFNHQGALVLSSLPQESQWTLTDAIPMTEMVYGWKRYGSCSEVWVRDRVTREVNKVVDSGQLALGLCCRKVVTTASQSSNQNRAYDGQYRLEESQKEMLQLRVVLPFLQFLLPGSVVEIVREDCPWNGQYRLMEVEASYGSGGISTALVLGRME